MGQVSVEEAELKEEEKPDIRDMDTLLATLKGARIDREKIEAVDNFLKHGQDDVARLQESMHDIMSFFVFQASRRALLTTLTKIYDEALIKSKEADEADKAGLQEHINHIAAAIKHADEEVRRLEYWSDVKAMASAGDSKGAADGDAGWDKHKWQGVDNSAPTEPRPV